MLYERHRSKQLGGKHRGCGCVLRLILLCLCCWFVLIAVKNGTITDFIQGRGGWRHVLLMGVDNSGTRNARTDTMMIASVSTGGKLKLTSIMRDTLVDMGERGSHKINAAYTYGGAQLAMNCVNDALGLNIRQYAVVDFHGLADIVDALGGITLKVTKAEARAMNGKKGHPLKSYGEDTLLNGVQVVRFVRLRKIDSDYQRTGRQRAVMGAIIKKIKGIRDPFRLFGIMKSALNAIDTNISAPDLMLMALRVMLEGGDIAQYRVPAEGTYKSGTFEGVWSIRADLQKNKKLLSEFIYG